MPEPPNQAVLVVDDHPANLALVRALLEADGFLVTEATSAEQALRLVRETEPSLILMDVRLPGEDGLSASRKLKSDPATASIPIIALTANAMKDDEAAALAAGCDGYISKPIDTRTFSSRIRQLIEASAESGPS